MTCDHNEMACDTRGAQATKHKRKAKVYYHQLLLSPSNPPLLLPPPSCSSSSCCRCLPRWRRRRQALVVCFIDAGTQKPNLHPHRPRPSLKAPCFIPHFACCSWLLLLLMPRSLAAVAASACFAFRFLLNWIPAPTLTQAFNKKRLAVDCRG